jgi:hypothetical protein
MIWTTHSVILDQLRDIYSMCRPAGMLLHISVKFPMGTLKSSELFVCETLGQLPCRDKQMLEYDPFVVITIQSFPHAWPITTSPTCGVETAYSSGAPEFTTDCLWGSCCPIFSRKVLIRKHFRSTWVHHRLFSQLFKYYLEMKTILDLCIQYRMTFTHPYREMTTGIFAETLCDKVCQWLVAGPWLSMSSPPVFNRVRVARWCLVFCVVLCRSMMILLYLFFWPLYFLRVPEKATDLPQVTVQGNDYRYIRWNTMW